MALIDEVKLHVKAGDGGDGVVRWRHEKFKPKAGPGGGNGGKGGDVYAKVVDDLSYLEYYRFKKKFAAQNGVGGGNLGKEGANGDDLVLSFPRGTVLTNTDTGEQFDLDNVGDEILILKGGRGGLGNEHFKSSTNTTPYEWTTGTLGEEANFDAELKLFADAGFVGLPSVGKSTLLNSLTNANSKVGAYHFTTLEPYLGALGPYVLADIPGLIKGAAQGKGIGDKFLRHISRTSTLVHLVGLDNEDPMQAYQDIRSELEAYDPSLLDKDEIILLSKSDVVEPEEAQKTLDEFKQAFPDKDVYTFSAYNDDNIKSLKELLMQNFAEKNSQ